MKWGRILRFGRAPKPLVPPVQEQDGPDLRDFEKRLERLEQLDLEGQINLLKEGVERSAESANVRTLFERLEAQEGRLDSLSAGLLSVRRDTAINSVTSTANTLVAWLVPQNNGKARSCIEFVNRRLAAITIQIQHSDSPNIETKNYQEAVENHLKEQGFYPFVEN